MNKTELIVGLDLSFSSTGISLIKIVNDIPTSIEFHRVVYDIEPREILNITQHTYKLPANVKPEDLVCNDGGTVDGVENDFYSKDQALITLRSIVTTQRIVKIVDDKIKRCGGVETLVVNIEGFIMPDLAGAQQLRIIGGLIMLQGLVRSDLIKYKVGNTNIKNFRLYITSPSALKSYFTGNGNANKELMLDTFIHVYDGNILLPDTSSIKKVNDVVDAFALSINAFDRYYHNWKPKPKVKKLKKKKEKLLKKEYLTESDKLHTVDLLMNSIPV